MPLEKFEPSRVKRAIVVSSTAIGDALFAVPGIRALKRILPGVSIDFMLRDKVAGLFEDFALVDEIIPYRGRYRNGLLLVKRLKRKRYDICIVFHDSDSCPVTAASASGIPFIFRIGQKDEKTAHLLSARIPYDNGKHAIDQRLEVLRRIFNKALDSPEDLRMDLPVDHKKVQEFRKRFMEQTCDSGMKEEKRFFIAFQFSASGAYKEWPEENFVRLGAGLIARRGLFNIVLVGGPSDIRKGERIKKNIEAATGRTGRVLNMAGRVSLKDLPVVMRAMDLLVTNDTGPLHVAISVGTMTVSLFVPSNLCGTGPVQDLHLHKVISKPKPCSPCVEKYCRKPYCMGLISPEEVDRAVVSALCCS